MGDLKSIHSLAVDAWWRRVETKISLQGEHAGVWLAGLLILAGQLGLGRGCSQSSVASMRFEQPSLQDLTRHCRLGSTTACDVDVATPVRVTSLLNKALPSNLKIHFSPRGVLMMGRGVLDLSGSTIESTDDHQIFVGSGLVKGLHSARPEWFAQQVGDSYPESALRSAYLAVGKSGTIILGEHAYLSPFFDPASPGSCGGHSMPVNTSLALVGAKRPAPDSDTAPTRLLAGTIIRGEICGTGVLHASHLGVDEGPYVVSHDFGGKKSFGIQLASTGKRNGPQGTTIDDVAVLTNGMKDQHSVIIEGQRHAVVRNLWIWSRGGTHGLVLKSNESRIENFHCAGASANCLILKSDFATDHAGDASDAEVHGVFIHALSQPEDTGGIELEGRWDSLRRLNLSDIHEDNLSFGILASDSLLHSLSNVHITDWIAHHIGGPCLVLDGTENVVAEHFNCSILGRSPEPAFMLRGRAAVVRDGEVTCVGTERECLASGLDGFEDDGHGDRFDDIRGANLGGHLVCTSPHHGGSLVNALDASAMGDRASTPYLPPPRTLAEIRYAWIHQTKGLLRVLWTQAATNFQGRWIAAFIILGSSIGIATLSFTVYLHRGRGAPTS